MYQPSQKASKTARLLLITTLVLLTVCWVFLDVWTAGLGLGWHAIHGGSTSFEGHKIHVPWDMVVLGNADNKGPTMLRESARYPIFRFPSGVMMISRGPQLTDMSKFYDKIAQAESTPTLGYGFRGLLQISAPKGQVYCWELARPNSSDLHISCWFDKDSLIASFIGDSRYRQEFYNAVQIVSGASPTSNQQ
jgi:hypothetical protein